MPLRGFAKLKIQCKGINSKGTPCQIIGVEPNGFCCFHQKQQQQNPFIIINQNLITLIKNINKIIINLPPISFPSLPPISPIISDYTIPATTPLTARMDHKTIITPCTRTSEDSTQWTTLDQIIDEPISDYETI